MNLADLISRNAAFTPDKDAIRYEGRAWTYAALERQVEQVTAMLGGLDVRRGDRVAILAQNHPDTLFLLYACARLGAILLPLNWRLAVPELAYIVAHAEPRLLVVLSPFEDLAPALASAAPTSIVIGSPEGALNVASADAALRAKVLHSEPWESRRNAGVLSDPLLLVYTSGTTGRPKGAVLTQDALLANGVMSGHMHGLTAADHILTVLPFFHVGGLNIQTTPALLAGATVTIHARFDAGGTLRAIAAERPTLTVLVPATMQACIDHPFWPTADLSCLRAVATGSTYVPQTLVDAFEARGVPVLQVYGATETAPVAIYTRLGGERRRPGSTGWPGLLCEAKVVDEAGNEVPHGLAGEIWVRGPQVMSGYWRDPSATAEALVDGWFRTGDVATRDPDGAFTVHDRKKNVIISGGENIYPAEIERVLLAHPAVAEAAVIGRPDPRWGETPVAVVVLRGSQEIGEAALSSHLLAELARFKVPRHYRFVDALPKSALGKVQHHLLRERVT